MSDLKTEYEVTYDDFRESMKGYRKIKRFADIVYYIDVWVLPLTGAGVTIAWLSLWVRGNGRIAEEVWFLPLVGLLAAIALPVTYQARMRAGYRQRTSLAEGKKVIFSANSDMLRFVIPGSADVSYPWATITSVFETDSVITLYIKKAAFHTLPKRAFSSDQLNLLHSYLQPHIESASC